MNPITIQRFIESSIKTSKGQIKGKKISGKRERRTNQYWKDVNRILRKKQSKKKFNTTHRIEAQPEEGDIALENIHFANYLGQKDLKYIPQYNSEEPIRLYKNDPSENIEYRDEFTAWDEPICRPLEGEGIVYNRERVVERLYIVLPEFKGETYYLKEYDQHICADEKYLELQRKFYEIIDLHADYMDQMYQYERDQELSDDDSVRSYQSWK